MKLDNIAIFGGGYIGIQFAALLLQAGAKVTVYEKNADPFFIGRARAAILNNLFFASSGGKRIFASNAEILEAFSGLAWCEPTDNNLAGLDQHDAVIEAIVENEEAKWKLHNLIETWAPMVPHFSSTSTVLAKNIAKYLIEPKYFANLHPSTPLAVMTAMEIIPHNETSDSTLNTGMELVALMGKKAMLAPDIPGFVENRILFSMISEAFNMIRGNFSFKEIDKALGTGAWTENFAALQIVCAAIHAAEMITCEQIYSNCRTKVTEAEIDEIMVSMAGFPIGPFALKARMECGETKGIVLQRLFRTIDLVGLDIVLHGLESLARAEPKRWEVPDFLKAMVADGKLGEKSGEGFYSHGGNITMETVVVPGESDIEVVSGMMGDLPETVYGKITLNGKYLSSSMVEKLEEAILVFERNPEVKGIVIALHNMLGAEVAEFPAMLMNETLARRALEKGHSLIRTMRESSVPILAVVSKRMWGGALEVPLGADMIVAEKGTELRLPETANVGLLPGYGGTRNLTDRVGYIKGLKFILTDETISAATPWVDEVVPEINWDDIGMLIARGIQKRIRAPITFSCIPESPPSDLEDSKTNFFPNTNNWQEMQVVIDDALDFWKENPPESFWWAIDAVIDGCQKPIAEGMEIEIECFLKALKTPEAEARVRAILFPVRAKK